MVFIRDLSERVEREREREQLYREQTARQEAEHMASMVHGLQMLLDAALAHSRLERMMEALLPRLCEVLDAEAASIFIVDEDSGALQLRASTGGLPAEHRRLAPPGTSPLACASHALPLLVNHPPADELADPAMRPMNSVIAVPLTAGEEATGVIQVGIGRSADVRRRRPAAAGSGRRPGGACPLPRAGLRARAQHRRDAPAQPAARTPALAARPGGGGALHPGGQRGRGGGDWYDVIPLDSSRVGLVMGDVAGKGLAAASMVGRLRSALRAYALEGHEPAEVVTAPEPAGLVRGRTTARWPRWSTWR